jgi:inner membrane protein
MLGRSHATIGAAAGVAAAHLLGTESVLARAIHAPGPAAGALAAVATALIAGPLAAVAALMPDLDEPGSTLGALLPDWWHHLTHGHRRSTHSLLAVAVVWAGVHYGLAALGVSGFAAELLTALIVVGMASHLAADAITDHGVPLLWPIRWHFRLPLFRTGSWLEHATVTAAVLATAWWTYDLGRVVTLARHASTL